MRDKIMHNPKNMLTTIDVNITQNIVCDVTNRIVFIVSSQCII